MPVETKPIYRTGHFWIGLGQIVYAALGLYLKQIDVTAAFALASTGLATIGVRLNPSAQPASLTGGTRFR